MDRIFNKPNPPSSQALCLIHGARLANPAREREVRIDS
jgi:hypothetical protein